MDNSLFGISYDSWLKSCQMYLYLPSGTQKSHLQLFPFSKLTRNEKLHIKSETRNCI